MSGKPEKSENSGKPKNPKNKENLKLSASREAASGKAASEIPASDGVPGDFEEPLVAHLKELRKRLFFVLGWLLLGMLLAYPFSEKALEVIWNEFLSSSVDMAVYSPLEWVLSRLKLCFVFALSISIPQLLYQLYRFAGKGLYPHEKSFLRKVVPASFLLFVFGAGIGYFLVLPLLFKFLIVYSGDLASAQLSVHNTLSAVTTILAGFGIVFQAPLLVVFAVKMGVLRSETLKKQRVLVYSLLAGFALFLSPDPTFISQALVALLLVILFEFSLILVRFF
ncbi:MAG: twin-arginine translocase subunit TatC [Methanosarcinaceae archaeon]|nr:twin-arginine translocase subunit TatC [Methanosarcinaceae archaeon]